MAIEERVKYYYLDKFVGATKEGTGKLINYCIEETVKKEFRSGDYE